MVNLGYTLMSEQSGPKDLVRFAALAEQAGFDFEVMSDHYFPVAGGAGALRLRVEHARSSHPGD